MNSVNPTCHFLLSNKKVIGKGKYGTVILSKNNPNRVYKIILKKYFKVSEFRIGQNLSENKLGPKIYDKKICGNFVLIEMEKLDYTLDKWLLKKRTKKELKEAYKKIIRLIKKFHKLGFVHGDLKLDNIGKIGKRWVLIDFGHTHNKYIKKYKNSRGFFLKLFLDFAKTLKRRPLTTMNSGYDEYFRRYLIK